MNFRQSISIVLLSTILFTADIPVSASAISSDDLHALSAVLMDGDSGRVLYEKSGDVPRPNASTTKVMTCILALENGKGDDYVMVSKNAAAQPEVKLGLKEGEQYYLEDLLYSLMLKSHNDTAVAIAEHIGGSVEGFAHMMNEKAKVLGCKDTHFVTPNGLDAEDEGGIHHTTARDLALIMAYAIKNETFVHITQTRDYTFSDISGKEHYSVHNTNAFLDMETGVISGKTGFTGNAGYCYVCAVRQDEKLFIVALLGCGWPGNKNYKWSDTKKLLSYGRENYSYVLLPDLADSDITAPLAEKKYMAIVPIAAGLQIASDSEAVSLLNTTDSAYSKLAGYQQTTYEKEEGDIDGPFSLGVDIQDHSSGRILFFSSSYLLDDMYNAYSSGANDDLVMNALSALMGDRQAMSIRSKSLNYNYLTISESAASLIKLVMIGLVPLCYLAMGVATVWDRRRMQK